VFKGAWKNHQVGTNDHRRRGHCMLRVNMNSPDVVGGGAGFGGLVAPTTGAGKKSACRGKVTRTRLGSSLRKGGRHRKTVGKNSLRGEIGIARTEICAPGKRKNYEVRQRSSSRGKDLDRERGDG